MYSILNDFSWKFKNILFLNQGLLFIFYANGHIYNVVSILSNILKMEVENDTIVSMMLFQLIYHCLLPLHQINLKTMLRQFWNIFWSVE